MKIFLYGSDGFVARGFKEFFNEKNINYECINRRNFSKYKNSKCDLFINVNGNSSKIMADKNFLKSYKINVNSTLRSINNIKFKKYIFISTCSVYSDTSKKTRTREDSKVDLYKLSNYGFIKAICEGIVMKKTSNYLIIRPSAFIGNNLKKNIIFDLMNNKKIFDNKKSTFHFMDTYSFAKITYGLAIKNLCNKIFNITSKKNITSNEINNFFFKKKVSFSRDNYVANNISTKKISNYFDLKTSRQYISYYLEKNKNANL